MTTQMSKCREIVKSHYNLGRSVAITEVLAEINNINRKLATGCGLDDMDSTLKVRLEGKGQVQFYKENEMTAQQTLLQYMKEWVQDSRKFHAAIVNPHMLECWDDIVWEDAK